MNLIACVAGVTLAVASTAPASALPVHQALAAQWGSGYGDPHGFCTNHSALPGSYGVVVTNDPLVGNNPEQDTFFGYHPYPGYDDWYGFFYGDFRGRPEDNSGWTHLTRDAYPNHSHWNFADFGWSVHGHVKRWLVSVLPSDRARSNLIWGGYRLGKSEP